MTTCSPCNLPFHSKPNVFESNRFRARAIDCRAITHHTIRTMNEPAPAKKQFRPGQPVKTRAGGYLKWQDGTYERLGADGLHRVKVGKTIWCATDEEVFG